MLRYVKSKCSAGSSQDENIVLHFVDSQTSVIFEKPIVRASLAVMTKVAMMSERPLTRSAFNKVKIKLEASVSHQKV